MTLPAISPVATAFGWIRLTLRTPAISISARSPAAKMFGSLVRMRSSTRTPRAVWMPVPASMPRFGCIPTATTSRSHARRSPRLRTTVVSSRRIPKRSTSRSSRCLTIRTPFLERRSSAMPATSASKMRLRIRSLRATMVTRIPSFASASAISTATKPEPRTTTLPSSAESARIATASSKLLKVRRRSRRDPGWRAAAGRRRRPAAAGRRRGFFPSASVTEFSAGRMPVAATPLSSVTRCFS